MYILDTSALKSIPKHTLVDVKTRYDLGISPLTFYELLCHLDETVRHMTFPRQKGILLKCQVPKILHDPFAYHANTIGATHITNPTRFEEPELIAQILNHLEECHTLDEFYEKTVSFPNGRVSSCRDVAKNVRSVLENEETRYVQHLEVLKDAIVEEYPNCPISGLTIKELSEIITSSLAKMIKDYREKDGLKDHDLHLKVVSSMAMHLGYKAWRISQYLKSMHLSGGAFVPDKNDCEDSYIAMYLELLKQDSLVTGDEGTLAALNATKEAASLFFKNASAIACRVLSPEAFVSETGL